MSGFDRQGVDAEFFPDGRWQSNFLVNLGYGDKSKLWPRNPRLAFDEACQILLNLEATRTQRPCRANNC